ncbi:hypothetical protein M153_13875000441, partial [Pseudoloma neurophilia]
MRKRTVTARKSVKNTSKVKIQRVKHDIISKPINSQKPEEKFDKTIAIKTFSSLSVKYSVDKMHEPYLLKIFDNMSGFFLGLEYLNDFMIDLYCQAIFCLYFEMDQRNFIKQNSLKSEMFKKACKEVKKFMIKKETVQWRVGLFTIRD